MESELVDTTLSLKSFLDSLSNHAGKPPVLYVDLEGNGLFQNGTLSLVTILVESGKVAHLIDVTKLGKTAFSIAGTDGRSLRDVLESNDIIKVSFDIRNDSDALISHHEIRVSGFEDLQLMELPLRTFSKECVNRFAKCIARDSTFSFLERQQRQRVRDKESNEM